MDYQLYFGEQMDYNPFLNSIKLTPLYQQVISHKIIKYKAICGYKIFQTWKEIDKQINYDFFIYLKRSQNIKQNTITTDDIIKFIFTSLSPSNSEDSIRQKVESILADMDSLKISGVAGLTKKVCGLKPY